MVKVGIIGAEESKWPKEKIVVAQNKIHDLIWAESYMNFTNQNRSQYVIVSGHCPFGGVDIWVEEYAKYLAIPTEIYPPKGKHWNDHYTQEGILKEEGYKSRNIQIAEAVGKAEPEGVMYCVNPKGIWSGGSWTLEYFKKHFPARKGVLIEI